MTRTPALADSRSLGYLRDWIGRSERRSEIIAAAPIAGLSATLDRVDDEPAPGASVPPLGHWLYFLPRAAQREIDVDGHPRRGGFLPPVPLSRRMWAGGRLSFERPLRVGEGVNRLTTIKNVEIKHGRSGDLVFVTVSHQISDPAGIVLIEEQDIVYRDNPSPDSPAPTAAMAPTDEAFCRDVAPDPVLLFRYSALTFNGHRIHYDRWYATEVEGYPGLVVHGPLIATLLVDLLRHELPEVKLRTFTFRAVSPLFDIHPFTLCGKLDADGRMILWARNHEGKLAMQAHADLD